MRRMSSPHRKPLLVVALLLSAPAEGRAQDPGSPGAAGAEPPTTAALLARLGAKDLRADSARELWASLADRPVAARGQALELLRRRYLSTLPAIDKERERLHKLVRKLAPELQRRQLGKPGLLEVDKLRSEALAVTRRPELTKQAIVDEIDPRRARLAELLLPTAEQLRAADPAFAAAWRDADLRVDEARAFYDLYLGGVHTLDEVPGGRRIVDAQKPVDEPPPRDTIDNDLELWRFAALPMSAHDHKALLGNAEQRRELEPEEYLGTLELNRIRYTLGLPLLAIDPKLTLAARDHSQDMLRLGFFSHTSPIDGKQSPGQRAARFGTSGGAENIAAGQSTGNGAITAWWYSPGHHKNLLGGHGRTGLGRAESLWTQMFGG